MKSIAHSNIAKPRRSALPSKLSAMLALGFAGAVVLAGSIAPAAAHKQGGGGGRAARSSWACATPRVTARAGHARAAARSGAAPHASAQ